MSEMVSPASGPLTSERIREFFTPKSIALVGLTEIYGWSSRIVDNVRALGPQRVSAVHPKRSVVWGMPAVPRLQDLAEPVDLAFVLAPNHAVETIMRDAHEAGVRNLVILAAGFGEVAGGRERQESLVTTASDLDLTVLGPNCIGFINAGAQTAPFAGYVPKPRLVGSVSFLLQSGAIAFGVNQHSVARGVGTNFLCTMGNEAMLTTEDVLEYVVADESTSVIALFLEQVRDPERFSNAARRALAADKPIVVMKVGRSATAREAATAHTGAIASEGRIVDAFLEDCGIVSVASLEELIGTAGLLAHTRGNRPAGRRMAVVAGSGGACGIIGDRAEDLGLTIPQFAPSTLTELVGCLPDGVTPGNPIDVTGLARTGPMGTFRIDDTLAVAARDPNIDFAFYMGTASPRNEQETNPALERRWDAVGAIMRDLPVPVVMWDYVTCDVSPFQREFMASRGLHITGGIEDAIVAAAHTVDWAERRETLLASRTLSRRWPARADTGPTHSWDEPAGRDLLERYGAGIVPGGLATSAADAVQIADEVGYPVAIKVCSAEIGHKSDVGGVQLRVADGDGVRRAYEGVLAAAAAAVPGARLSGVMVTAMRDGGFELFCGITVDPSFGPVLAVGLGGVAIEVLSDVALKLLPTEPADVIRTMDRLRTRQMLSGYRGSAGVDIGRLAEFIVSVTQAAESLGDELHTIEVNPIWASGEQIEALDVLVVTTAGGA